jgi:hypothetical protein
MQSHLDDGNTNTSTPSSGAQEGIEQTKDTLDTMKTVADIGQAVKSNDLNADLMTAVDAAVQGSKALTMDQNAVNDASSNQFSAYSALFIHNLKK